MNFDLLLKNGTVLDPSQGLRAGRDVAVAEGKIIAVEPLLPAVQAREVIDVSGKLVTPGLIDLHTHVYAGATTWGVKPDPACLRSGVTTAVDAGSAGWASFLGLRWHVMERVHTQVLGLVHISGLGLVCGRVGEMLDLAYADVERTAEMVRTQRDYTVGVKVRLGQLSVGENGIAPLQLALQAAEAAGCPVMVHIARGTSLPEVLELLRPGDIVTHCFQGDGDTILNEQGQVRPEVLAARERGVLFDVGHGVGSFRWEVATAALEQGFWPDFISTDLHTGNLYGPVYDLPTTLSKFLYLGLSVEEAIARTTVAPAQWLGRADELGTLREGTVADLAVWELEEGKFDLYDTYGEARQAKQRLRPVLTVRAGRLWQPEDWTPEAEEEVCQRFAIPPEIEPELAAARERMARRRS
ncbi:MAG TPA: amidohydrolase/deacetylase family metallohydrolase [Armatimonadetes bacterium]|nr:amidohydrolase/deacetylase family metallohydrolase [Armatimonadota bacterium]